MIALVGAAVLLTGCASIPDSGDVEPVKASQHGESQVRVYAVPPRKGAQPDEIVDGFLEAMTSDDPDFAIARKYLTKDAAASWHPEDSTTVLADAPDPAQPLRPAAAGRPGLTYPLQGQKIGVMDAAHTYRPLAPHAYGGRLHLVQQKKGKDEQWRIDSLPRGLLLGNSDFQRNYRPIDTYYFEDGRPWLVPDPVFIRQRIDPTSGMDPVTQAIRVLLTGPTSWLQPVAQSSFPKGSRLQPGVKSLEFDGRNALRIPLNAKAAGASPAVCRRMAAQLFYTLRDLTSTRVGQIEVMAGGSSLCAVDENDVASYSADRTEGPDTPYFVDAQGRLAGLGSKDAKGDLSTVPGPLGDGTVKLSSVAVARDEREAAGVSQDGTSLYVRSIKVDSDLGDPLVKSEGKTAADRLSAPSWDGFGDLWVADRDPEHSRLLRMAGGTDAPQEVPVEGLDARRIEGLRMSADGSRIALLLTEGDKTDLEVGRVERHGTGSDESVSVTGLQSVAPQMDSVTAVSWEGQGSLVLVGKETGGVQQILSVQVDGSAAVGNVLPGLNQVTAIAAGDDSSQPLVADSDDVGIVRLPSGGNWQTVVQSGASPVYPG